MESQENELQLCPVAGWLSCAIPGFPLELVIKCRGRRESGNHKSLENLFLCSGFLKSKDCCQYIGNILSSLE